MKVLLLKDIKNLGLKGNVKEVSEGYFRNFLLPKNLALVADERRVAHIQTQAGNSIQKLEKMKESAVAIQAKLEGKILELKEKAAENGTLYAAVHEAEIAAAIKEQFKVDLDASSIKISESIKHLGDFAATLNLFQGIQAKITIHVTSR